MPRGLCDCARNDRQWLELIQAGVVWPMADGRVLRGERELRGYRDREGYRFIGIRLRGRRLAISLGRLVWMACHGVVVPVGHDIHHVDGDIANNVVWNLEPRLPSEHRCNSTSFGALDF